jgi:hypothetical protein
MNKTLKTGTLVFGTLVIFSGCDGQFANQPSPFDNNFVKEKKEIVEKPLPAKLTLTNFSVNKPLLFRPFDKSNSSKNIYFSFIGQTTNFVDIKNKIETNLINMGYNISPYPNKSDLYVSIYMTSDKIESFQKTVNNYKNIEYNFNIVLEQHIKGKTKLAETYDIDGKNRGSSKQMKASAKLEAHHSTNIFGASTSMSDSGIGLFGAYNKGNKAMVSGKGTDKTEKKKIDTVAINHRSIKSETQLDYYLFKDEIDAKVNFEVLNMQGQDDKVNAIISEKLALRLAKLLDF